MIDIFVFFISSFVKVLDAEEEFAINREKTIISIRTKDFPNRLVMEKFIELLDAELDLNRLAIHDLGTLFELDYQSSMNEN